jgi:para-nitrobenzyl esterase
VKTDVIARVAQGRLRGERDGDALRFLGIPYAESPRTAGRFTAPRPHPAWDGVRDALVYGATSPQPDRGVTLIPEPIVPGDNELNLNVFTPDLGAAGLPVLVWIHGGGFFGGCNASPWYRGGPFARDGVILVSINYRLGFSGFLEVDGAPVNRGVRDWIAALEWVRENIAAFGGDPDRVTIAGQSAGGGACAALLGAPAARGLFRGAICMSGGASLVSSGDQVGSVAEAMAALLGVPATAEAFEGLSAEAILAAQEALMAKAMATLGGGQDEKAVVAALGGGVQLPFGPWADGSVITAAPIPALAGRSDVSLLAGATANEFTMAWLASDWVTADMARDGLAAAGVPAWAVSEYLGRPGRPCEVVGQALTDRTFRAPAQRLASASPAAWAYDFRWSSVDGAVPGQAFHCLDVPFAFDNLHEPGVREAAGDAPPAALASAMHGAWVRFVADGDPGWSRYTVADRSTMLFDMPSSSVAPDPLAMERQAWPSALGECAVTATCRKKRPVVTREAAGAQVNHPRASSAVLTWRVSTSWSADHRKRRLTLHLHQVAGARDQDQFAQAGHQ